MVDKKVELVLAGLVFVVLGAWWAMITSIRFMHVKRAKRSVELLNRIAKYNSTLAMPCACLPCFEAKRAPVEGFIKLAVAVLSLVIVAATSANSGNEDKHVERGVTICLAFVLSTFVELLVHYNKELPARLEYVAAVGALSIEAFIADSGQKSEIYSLLVFIIRALILFHVAEMVRPGQVLFAYGRSVFTILHGTWLFKIGLELGNDSVDKSVVLAVELAWHLMAVVGFVFLAWTVARYFNYELLIYIDFLNKADRRRRGSSIDDLVSRGGSNRKRSRSGWEDVVVEEFESDASTDEVVITNF
jgi:hypothetical protein